MKENPVKRQLAGGGVAVGSFLVELDTVGTPRLLAAAGADFVLYDQEHTAWSIEALRPRLAAARALGVVPLVRVPAAVPHLIATAADSGAMGVMVPMVESAEQAGRIVAAAKYPPTGRRGLGPLYADELDADLPSTMARIDREQLLLVQIETVAGLEHVEEIAAVEGIDVLWVGHGDLTTSMGIPGSYDDPRFLAALDRVVAAAEGAGKSAGMMPTSPDEGRAQLARGFRCLAYADRPLLDRALREAYAAVRER